MGDATVDPAQPPRNRSRRTLDGIPEAAQVMKSVKIQSSFATFIDIVFLEYFCDHLRFVSRLPGDDVRGVAG